MELDKMPLEVVSTGGHAEDATQESIATSEEPEEMTPQEIYAQRMRCQYEVMKLLGFLSPGFDPKDIRPESEAENSADMILWCQNINGVKETSNAAVFDREYKAITGDKKKFGLLKSTGPENQDARDSILQELAGKLIPKKHLVS